MGLRKRLFLMTALALTAVLGAGCGQNTSDSVQRAGDAVQEEFDGAVEAARTGAVADAARAAADATQKATEAAQKQGGFEAAEKETKKVAKQLEENVENSIEVARKSYDEARKDGAGRLEAAGDAYDAVDETHQKE